MVIPITNLLCIRHPRYLGQQHPDLMCSACCTIFLRRKELTERMRQKKNSRRKSIYKWLTLGGSNDHK